MGSFTGGHHLNNATQAIRPRPHVERQIRQITLSGVFEEGDKLSPEYELVELFGVRRLAVQEVLRTLVGNRFVNNRPRARRYLRAQ